LTDAEIDHLAKKFRSHYLARGERRVNWSEQWKSWCLDEAKKKPKQPVVEAPAEIDWEKIAAFYARTGHWSRVGSEPGQHGCKCLPEILQKHGIDPKTGERPRRKTVGEASREACDDF
jgi:hypothetical protein